MNLITKLNNDTEMFLTLDKYDISDMSTSYTMKNIIESFNAIKGYYEKENLEKVSNLDSYIDFLFLKFITLYSEDLNFILDPYRQQFKEVIEYAKVKINQIEISSVINFIKIHYKDIFEYDQKYISNGIRVLSLNLIINFYNGVKDSEVFEYLIKGNPIFVFDNFESLYKIFKKDDNKLIKELFLEEKSFKELCIYRFEEICILVERFYLGNFKDIAIEIGERIFKYTEHQYNSREKHIYSLQNMIQRAKKSLYILRSENYKTLEIFHRKIEKEVEEYLMENGQELKYEISTDAYYKLMEDLDKKGFDYFTKYMTITHWQNSESLWYSRLEKEAKSYQASMIDFVGNSFNTNDYFTYGKVNVIDLLINSNSMALFYWFKDEDKANEFIISFKLVIDCIFDILEYDTKFDNLDSDIVAIGTILYDKNVEKSNIFYQIQSMYIISFLEKILRLIYICIEKDAFFDKAKITLGVTLGTSEKYDRKLDNIIGEHHHRWTRYYFLYEDKDVGHDLRNRLAHLRDISVDEITLPVFIKIVWITISTINSIFVNLINNREEEESL
jgi:hypothetical protein